jgi:hypothetical protein
VPYLWRVVRVEGAWRYVPIEFVRASDVAPGTPTNLESQQGFLDAFADRLDEFGAINLFGLATFNICRIPAGPDDLLLEATDSANRILTVRAEPRANQPLEELTETLWTFTLPEIDDVDDERESPMLCRGHCSGHCVGHCVGHCKAHCVAHCPGCHRVE